MYNVLYVTYAIACNEDVVYGWHGEKMVFDPKSEFGSALTMSLALTIFALVFLTELVSWIGKGVLLNIVRSRVSLCLMTDFKTAGSFTLYTSIYSKDRLFNDNDSSKRIY